MQRTFNPSGTLLWYLTGVKIHDAEFQGRQTEILLYVLMIQSSHYHGADAV
jgi:hypothetical protein